MCTNTEAGPNCSCPRGITGRYCETIIDQCQTNSCENNGTCQSLIDRYVCLCSTGFSGNINEIEIRISFASFYLLLTRTFSISMYT